MPKTLDITRILREQKELLRAGFQDRLVMTASITLRVNYLIVLFQRFFSPLDTRAKIWYPISAPENSICTVNRNIYSAQKYFGFSEGTHLGGVCETQISKNTEAYRSGHNG